MSLTPAWTHAAGRVRKETQALDAALYAAVAATPTPTLDPALQRLSGVADHSRLWMGIAALLAATGGAAGRRAATRGLLAVGTASAVTNMGLKVIGRRRRPDRAAAAVPLARHVPMPASPSFPSGHAASAFAFAAAAGHFLPAAGGPLRLLAAVVAYSRVHTGVHYPGDVVVGSLVGASTGAAVGALADRR